jgi:predicted RNA-binding Zn-ribbon protein involved in translation (DUF1610 family)
MAARAWPTLLAVVLPAATSLTPEVVPTISFSCPACGKTLEVKDEVAGQKVKCLHCDRALTASRLPT